MLNMTRKNTTEWCIEVLWGKIAMIAWGDPLNPPVLMFHGFMDTAATFSYLLEHLPDSYYYVSFDLPGHGKSDPFPAGPLVSQITMVEVVRSVVTHMRWDTFVCLTHSMGFIIATLYNYIYPGEIIKIIAIDPRPSISVYYYTHHQPTYQAQRKYDRYYENYGMASKVLPYDVLVKMVMKNRGVSEEQAQVLLSRSLVPAGNGDYRLSWDNKARFLTTAPLSDDTLYATMSQDAPSTLLIEATYVNTEPDSKFAEEVIKRCVANLKNYSTVKVEGSHDVHVIKPDVIAKYVIDFLNKHIENNGNKCKL